MVDVRYLLVDAATSDTIAELPLQADSPIPFRKNDAGQFSASMPCDHPAVTKANFLSGLREITVLRDDVPAWNGPISDIDVDNQQRRLVLTILEASAYFPLRVVEIDKTYTAQDRHDIARDVFHEVTNKLSTAGDGTASVGLTINATLPQFTVTSGDSGFTMDLTGSGLARISLREYLDKLAVDPDEGIEWCMSYAAGSVRNSCHRILTLGSPLGSTSPITVTALMTVSFGHTFSPLLAATRAHVRGAGITATKENTGSIADGWLLLDQRYDEPNISDSTLLANATREYRRLAQPPVKMPRLSYRPSVSLPFGFVGIGDTVPLHLDDPCDLLDLRETSRRVEGIDWSPPQRDQEESVALLLNLPLTDTGA